jgi:hypothetical protein
MRSMAFPALLMRLLVCIVKRERGAGREEEEKNGKKSMLIYF